MQANTNNQIEALKAVLPMVAAGQKDFAGSLLDQYANKGTLSTKQWFWVNKIAEDTETAGVPDFSHVVTGEPKPEPVGCVGSMSGLIQLFQTAKSHLKFPAIVLALPDGAPVKVYIAGAQSKTPGYIQVTDGGPYGTSTWYGRVSPQGTWEKSKATHDNHTLSAQVQDLLKALSADTAGTAAAHGKLTGCCCFCNKKLTDEKSTSVGYGKTCAKSYGMPYGKTH